jgi:hypothetical protein
LHERLAMTAVLGLARLLGRGTELRAGDYKGPGLSSAMAPALMLGLGLRGFTNHPLHHRSLRGCRKAKACIAATDGGALWHYMPSLGIRQVVRLEYEPKPYLRETGEVGLRRGAGVSPERCRPPVPLSSAISVNGWSRLHMVGWSGYALQQASRGETRFHVVSSWLYRGRRLRRLLVTASVSASVSVLRLGRPFGYGTRIPESGSSVACVWSGATKSDQRRLAIGTTAGFTEPSEMIARRSDTPPHTLSMLTSHIS